MNREDDNVPPTPAPTPQSPTGPPPNPNMGQAYPPPPVPPEGPVAKQRRRGPRPVPPGVPYHRVLSREKRMIWRGIAALALLMGGMLVFNIALSLLGAFIDLALGRSSFLLGGDEFTPVSQATMLLSLALLLPWSMFVQRWLYGVRGSSLHSVRSLFRYEVFGRALLVILPIWTIYLGIFQLFGGSQEVPWRFTDLIGMFVVVILFAPMQSAAEEYSFRGLAFRVAASWGRGPRVALGLGVVVSSLLFMAAHATLDPWLNLYYFTMGVALSLITWRTGGLEIAVVIHAVNNVIAFLLPVVTHSDFTEGMERSVGTGSAIMLVPCVLLAVITAVVWLRTRRVGPLRTEEDPARTPVFEQG